MIRSNNSRGIKTMNMYFIRATLEGVSTPEEQAEIKRMLLCVKRARSNKALREAELTEFCKKIHARECELAGE